MQDVANAPSKSYAHIPLLVIEAPTLIDETPILIDETLSLIKEALNSIHEPLSLIHQPLPLVPLVSHLPHLPSPDSNRRKCTLPDTSPATIVTPSGATAQQDNTPSPLKLAITS